MTVLGEVLYAIVKAFLPWIEAVMQRPVTLRDAPPVPDRKRVVQRMRRAAGAGVPIRRGGQGRAKRQR